MLVQSLQNASLFSGIFSVSGKTTEGGTDSFSTLFAQLSATTSKNELFTQNTSPDNNVASENTKAELTATQTKEIGKTALSDRNGSVKTKEVTTKQTVKTDKTEKTAITEEEVEAAVESFAAAVNAITEFLNISKEDLNAVMNDLGIQPSAIFEAENVKAIFVSFECKGDITMLLTDSSLLDKCNELMKDISDIFASLTETFEDASDIGNVLGNVLDTADFDGLLNRKTEKSEVELAGTYEKADQSEDVSKDTENGREMKIDFKKDTSKEETFKAAPKIKDKAHFTNDDAAGRFIENIQNAYVKGIDSLSDRVEAAFQIRSIAEQIMDSVKVLAKADTTSVEIQLTPEHLGKVNVSVEDNNGVITAKFRTENELSKEAIENNINQFRETLRERGIKVDKVEVSVSDFSFAKNDETQQNSQEEQGSKNKRHFTLEQINEKVEKHDLNDTLYIEQGYSTVTYHA